MSVIRINKTKDYTIMSNYHFGEKGMSLKAKGLLSLMLSLPENWDYSIAGLVAICKENETAIKNTLDELKRFGYLKIIKKNPSETKSGRIEYEYVVYEQKQDIEKQGIENLGVENQGQYNTNILNTKNKNKENILKETFSDQDFELSEPNLFDLAKQPTTNSIQGDLLKLLETQSEDDNINTLNSLCNETQTAVVELTEQNNGIKIKNILNKKKTINEKLMAKIVDIKLFAFFKVFYKEYPRHIARANAWKTFRLKFMDNTYGEMNTRFETIMKFLAVYKNNVSDKDTQYIKHPASWLNSEFL